MAARPYEVSFKADFGDLVRMAGKASGELTSTFNNAVEKGFSNVKLRGLRTAFEKQVSDEAKLREKLIKRQVRLQAEAEGKLAELQVDAAEEVADLQDKHNRATDQKTKKRLKAELDAAKERQEIYNETTDDFNEKISESMSELKKVAKEMGKASREAANATKYYDRTASRIGKITKIFTDSTGQAADDFVDKISSGMDGIIGKLTGSINAGDLVKGGAGAVSGGFRAMGDAVGMVAPKLGMLVSGMGMFIGVVGIAVGAILDFDKRIKDFNKSAVNTFGSMDLARVGGGDMAKTLRVLNRAVHDLNSNLGVTQEEAMSLLDTLDKGGLTMDRFLGKTRDLNDQQATLSRNIREVGMVARSMGVGISEYASTLTDYVNDLGSSLETVNESFAQIAKMASESSFGTRRFYSMVVQASSGQASLNTRLTDTADLLMRMTKILGQKKAMEMVQNHGSALANMGTQDRYRMVMQVGHRKTGQAISSDARNQASNFSQEATRGGATQAAAFTKALRTAGLSDRGLEDALTRASRGDTDDLVSRLSRLSQTQQGALSASVTAQMGDGLGRQISQLVGISRGTRGGIENQTSSFDSASARMSIRMQLEQLRALSPNGNLQGIDRMRGEQLTGLSGQAVAALIETDRTSRGQYSILQQALAQNEKVVANTARDVELATTTNATIRNGQIVAARVNAQGQVEVGEQIHDANDLTTHAAVQNADSITNALTLSEQLMQKTFDQTVSVGDILESKIYQILTSIYETVGLPVAGYLMQLVNALPGGGGGVRENPVAARQALSAELAKQMQKDTADQRTAQRELSATGQGLAGAVANSPEQQKLLEKKKMLEADIAARDQRMQSFSRARERLNTGNNWDVRNTNETGPAMVATADALARILERDREQSLTPAQRAERQAAVDRSGPHGMAAPTYRSTTQPVSQAPDAPIQGNTAAPTAASTSIPGARAQAEQIPGVTPQQAAALAARTTPPSAAASAPTAVPSPAERTGTVTRAVRESAQDTVHALGDHADAQEENAERRHRSTQQNVDRVLTKETRLGDALARSKLPAAIAEAQAKQQLMSAMTGAGVSPEDATRMVDRLMSGEALNADDQGKLSSLPPEFRTMLQQSGYNPVPVLGDHRMRVRTAGQGATNATPTVDSDVEDFIYRGNGANGSITPIHTADQFLGMRPGGPVDRAMGGAPGGSGGNVTVNINGGDQRQVYDAVRRALRTSGVTPSRVPASA